MSHSSSGRPSSVTVSCPHCNRRLRFSVPEMASNRVRIQCASCESTFVLRRPGTGESGSSQTALSQEEPPLLVGLPEPPASASADDGLPTSPLLRQDALQRREHDGQTLAAGMLLASRYRVVRFLAQGGMGKVYEVEDLVLKEHVAAKTVQPEMARDAMTIERFRREIQLARKVTHPNVCRIFDLSHHHPEEGGEPIEFLTMELLAGETLSARLRRGPLPPAEQHSIARQVLEGLDAAHRAGVVHRDLKPGNVLLVPDRDGIRAVVTDFGLARLESSHRTRGTTLTGADGFLGTPAYLAPEQVEGGDVTTAVDLYAMGIVLYEMATGRVPFESDSLLATAVKRLREAPTPPRVHAPGIDPRWEGVILRCLERNPVDRYATARDVLEALAVGSRPRAARESRTERPAAESVPRGKAASRTKTGPPGARRGLKIAILAALILASFAVAIYRVAVWKRNQALAQGGGFVIAPVSAVPRRAVAVLGFKNLSGNPQSAWLSSGLAEMLATELGAAGDLRIVAGETVARTKLELNLADSDSLARDTLARVRTALGAEDVVLGSYLVVDNPSGRQLRLDLRIQDAVAGETRLRIAETAAESQLFDLVARVGRRLRQELGVEASKGGGRSTLPSRGDAARLYTEGIDRLRRFDPVTARDLLTRAVEADPGNPLARSALAAACAALGYDGLARQEARLAVERSSSLPQDERLSIEGQYREIHADWPKAVTAYRKLWALYPDDLEHGLRLANAQTAAGQTDAALATLDTLRTLPAPLRDDPRIDLAEATAAGIRADFKRQSAAATRARSKGTTLGTTLLAAEAALSQCRALRSLGQPDRALAACAEGSKLQSALGNQAGVAEAATLSANALFDRGDLPGALTRYQEALATYREIGNRGGEAGALNNLAVVHRSQGNLEQAQQLYQEALAIFRDLASKGGEANALNNLAGVSFRRGELEDAAELYTQALALRREQKDASGEAYALDNLGVALRRRGDLAGARVRHEEALGIRRRTGQRLGIAASLRNLGSVLLDQGQLGEAKKRFDEALAIGRSAGSRSEIAYALFGAGEVAVRTGRLSEARKLHEEALALRVALGEKGTAAESRLALAGVLLESGDAPRSGYLAREAVEELGRQGENDKEGLALSLSALAARAQGDALAARDRIDRAVALVAGGQDLRTRLTVSLRALEIGRTTDAGQIERALAKIMDEATRAGLVEQRLEAALASAQLAARRGQSSGVLRSREVSREAASLGFAKIAQRAGTIGSGPVR